MLHSQIFLCVRKTRVAEIRVAGAESKPRPPIQTGASLRSAPATLMILLCVGLLTATVAPVAAADERYDPDEQFLKESKVAADAPGLVKYLQQRSGHDDDLLHLDELIRQLSSPDFKARRQAAEKLVAVGPPAHALLLEAQKDK